MHAYFRFSRFPFRIHASAASIPTHCFGRNLEIINNFFVAAIPGPAMTFKSSSKTPECNVVLKCQALAGGLTKDFNITSDCVLFGDKSRLCCLARVG